MKTADFDFVLPPELIAQHPAEVRDQSRMLVLHRSSGTWEHRVFSDFPGYTRPGDLVVLNNTRVIPARIYGRKEVTGGAVEIFVLEQVDEQVWDVLLRARRRPAIGAHVVIGNNEALVTMLEERELGRARVRIEAVRPWIELLEQYGETPLPPYIQRGEGGGAGEGNPAAEDRERYQTIYAREKGAVAAPTAGLHFTDQVFRQLENQGVGRAEVTLHVGLGTFRPVTAESILDHRMEAERFTIPAETAARVNQAHQEGGRVIAVGSTSVRTLENASTGEGRIRAASGRTDLFIHPPFTFQVVDAILTNFHLPKSTLLMMMSAFAGRELLLAAYEEAIRERYRFYSYGDCMLIV